MFGQDRDFVRNMLQTISIKGEVSTDFGFNLSNGNAQVILSQNDSELGVYDVVNGKYVIIHEVILDQPFTFLFKKSNHLTKSIVFDFPADSLDNSILSDTFFLVENIDIDLEYKAPLYSGMDVYKVARFTLSDVSVILDMDFVIKQKEEFEKRKTNYSGKYQLIDNGEKVADLNYKDGKLNGKNIWYNIEGENIVILNYIDGEMQESND